MKTYLNSNIFSLFKKTAIDAKKIQFLCRELETVKNKLYNQNLTEDEVLDLRIDGFLIAKELNIILKNYQKKMDDIAFRMRKYMKESGGRMVKAMDFPSEEALHKYLRDHPHAIRENHRVIQRHPNFMTKQETNYNHEGKKHGTHRVWDELGKNVENKMFLHGKEHGKEDDAPVEKPNKKHVNKWVFVPHSKPDAKKQPKVRSLYDSTMKTMNEYDKSVKQRQKEYRSRWV